MTSVSTVAGARSAPALLAVLVPAVLVTVVASDMVTLMLPTMGTAFGAGEPELAWVVTGFLLTFSVGIPFYGRVSDRFSLRGLFVFALLVYALGTLVCALAASLLVLVTGRVVAGMGAAGLPVLSVVAVTRTLPEGKRGMGIGVVSAGAGIGAAAGPAIGGGAGQLLGWPALFWIMFVAALSLLPAAWKVLPGERPAGAGGFDMLGGILLGAGAGLALFGMTRAQVAGFADPAAWTSLVSAVAAFVLFGFRTARAAKPFIPLSLLRDRVYRIALVVVFLAMMVNLGGLVFVPLLVVEVNGLTPGAGALVMIPAGIVAAVLAPAIGRAADRFGARPLVLTGLALITGSALALSTFAGGSSVVPAGAGMAGIGLGFLLVLTPLIGAVAGVLPAGQAGAGIGILQGAQFLGAGTGPAVFGVLAAARADADAFNPLYSASEGQAYSDVFLVMAAIGGVALLIASGLQRSARLRRRPRSPASP
ncbi:MFS transporter [Prauserella marina]|uniref:MFS transporter, DHA2 family, metal-tetracycline-proton antiporter/MFS transporter, DHA2 family, florfenicol/chloramphenicol resistance protein n=1 Tax=Prauserella marina TaxID=530584 RepID=A0A222VTK1_9PSEU|nr:MFS transporter [Prauserella marina]ASR37256.1 MFS transporter [Prauserella marina]PWV72585.1 DHA2 family metal-tetracycline-proton antiporter-like MFS transporter/DHA2 family florfenicol/chloramphenicol resistance protein-like MFS transporter [Prauserella marina]SDD76577.1 MFS transporter, DHA2 family, metal-tetracycline-proton antiporter/MFS transporter, DHA2 family, florfenicol/chloramphenicol resistance protein [Prauserella marina]